MKVTTALNGTRLRDYAQGHVDNPRVSIFPEAGLSPDEQAAFLLERGDEFDEIITFSPFILSDTPQEALNVLDDEQGVFVENHRQGASVNKITMNWRRETIGEIAKQHFDALREKALGDETPDYEALMRQAYDMGDSVEQTLLINTLMDAQKKSEENTRKKGREGDELGM